MVSVADGGHRYPCWAHFKERPFKDWTLLRLWINFPLIFPLSFWQHLRPLWPHLWPRLIINLQPKQKMHFFYGWASFSAGWLAHFRAHELKNGRSTQRGVTHAPLCLSLSLSLSRLFLFLVGLGQISFGMTLNWWVSAPGRFPRTKHPLRLGNGPWRLLPSSGGARNSMLGTRVPISPISGFDWWKSRLKYAN